MLPFRPKLWYVTHQHHRYSRGLPKGINVRVMLIATNRHDRLMGQLEARPLPIGLAYVAGLLDLYRHTLKVLDLMFSTDYLVDVGRCIREFEPNLIGVSLRNLDNQSYLEPQWALPFTKEVIQRIRGISNAPIVCGGPAFSILPRECFRFLEPDLGIAGDAGEIFAQLADRLDGGEPYHDLPGMVYREGEEIIVHESRASSAFPKLPRLEELDMARYQQAGFGVGVLTKLGDFHYPTTGDQNETVSASWRVIRPIDEVMQEVLDLKRRFGLRKVFFIDSGFNIPLPHAKSLCQSLIEADLKLHWNTCLAPVPQVCDEEIVALMRRAGCSLVLMAGIGGQDDENGDMDSRIEPLREVCRLCEKGGLHYTISQYFGEPGETSETVEIKLAFLRELSPAMANLRVGVRVLPGSLEARAALQEGLITDEGQLIRPTFYLAETIKEWIVGRLKDEAAENPRWNLI